MPDLFQPMVAPLIWHVGVIAYIAASAAYILFACRDQHKLKQLQRELDRRLPAVEAEPVRVRWPEVRHADQ